MANIQFQFRRGTAAQWTTNGTVVLASGEMGIETDTSKFKIGDGSTQWNSLAYGGIQGYTGSKGFTGSFGYAGSAGDRYHTTSTTSLNLSTYALTNTISLTTVDLELDYSPQQTILIASTATPTNHIHAKVLTYNASTGALTAEVSDITAAANSTLTSWEINLDGAVGIRGFTGSLGYTGSRGFDGSVGFTGSIGYTGSKGFDGSFGYTGSRGFDGSVGFTGSIGYSGSQGYNGSTGFTGSIGYTGSRGFDGSVGFTGSKGFDGSVGFTGSKGFDGSVGFTGSLGYTGSASTVVGYTGSKGFDGSVGFTGSAATTGTITFSTNTISGASNTNITISPNGTGKVDVNSKAIINVTDPTNAQDAATKNYVDNATSSSATTGFAIAQAIALG